MRYGSKASYAYPRHSPHTAHRIMVLCEQAPTAPYARSARGSLLTRDIKTTVSTWLDCSRLMSDFSVRSREFIKAYFCLKTHRFLPLYVLGNRSKTLLLLIISKHTDLPTASRLRSDGTSLKPHRLNIRILIHQVFLQIRILPFLLQ